MFFSTLARVEEKKKNKIKTWWESRGRQSRQRDHGMGGRRTWNQVLDLALAKRTASPWPQPRFWDTSDAIQPLAR